MDHLDKFILHSLNNALIARFIKKKGIDYIVRRNEIIIVDNATGRLTEGRTWSDGLHQAVQAKEGVEIDAGIRNCWHLLHINVYRINIKIFAA